MSASVNLNHPPLRNVGTRSFRSGSHAKISRSSLATLEKQQLCCSRGQHDVATANVSPGHPSWNRQILRRRARCRFLPPPRRIVRRAPPTQVIPLTLDVQVPQGTQDPTRLHPRRGRQAVPDRPRRRVGSARRDQGCRSWTRTSSCGSSGRSGGYEQGAEEERQAQGEAQGGRGGGGGEGAGGQGGRGRAGELGLGWRRGQGGAASPAACTGYRGFEASQGTAEEAAPGVFVPLQATPGER